MLRAVPFDTGTVSILTALPIGIALVIVLQGPWVYAVLSSKLRPASQFVEMLAAKNTEIADAKAETATWKEAWKEERQRGDDATASLAAARLELGEVVVKLSGLLSPTTPQSGATMIEAPATNHGGQEQ